MYGFLRVELQLAAFGQLVVLRLQNKVFTVFYVLLCFAQKLLRNLFCKSKFLHILKKGNSSPSILMASYQMISPEKVKSRNKLKCSLPIRELCYSKISEQLFFSTEGFYL